MSQKHKNTTLLVILGLLVSNSIILELTGETSINTIENKEIFSVQDTSIVDFISIKSIEEDIQLKKVESTWSVNEKYKAEQNIVQVLLSILKTLYPEGLEIEALYIELGINKREYSRGSCGGSP